MIWILCIALALAAAAYLMLAGTRQVASEPDDQSLQVYKDQLAEIDRDKQRGLLSDQAAEAARVEVQRRILAAGRRGVRGVSNAKGWHTYAAWGLVGVSFAGALLGYGVIGSPGMPSYALDLRLERAADGRDTQDLPARALVLRGWMAKSDRSAQERGQYGAELARLLLANGDARQGLDAMRAATQADPENADLWAEFGEMIYIVGQEQGVLPDAARQAVGRALMLDPGNPRGLFIGGMIMTADGNFAQAETLFTQLRRAVPDEEPLAEVLDQRLVFVRDMIANPPVVDENQPGPSQEDIQAAQEMNETDRGAMIQGMVERLAARLEQEPDDMAGWARLANAYLVLGQLEQAADAIAKLPDTHPEKAGLTARLTAHAGQ